MNIVFMMMNTLDMKTDNIHTEREDIQLAQSQHVGLNFYYIVYDIK